MTAAWSLLLMLGWLPGNGAAVQSPALSAPELLNSAPPAYVSVSEQLERTQRLELALEQSA